MLRVIPLIELVDEFPVLEIYRTHKTLDSIHPFLVLGITERSTPTIVTRSFSRNMTVIKDFLLTLFVVELFCFAMLYPSLGSPD